MESWASSLNLSLIDWPLAALVFVDFDGVLHAEDFDADLFRYLPILESVLRDIPEVGVVLTTSWRMDHSFLSLRDRFSRDLRHRVVAATPLLEEGMGDGGRWLEIQAFLLENHLSDAPFAILDDEARLFPAECDPLILTDRSGMSAIDGRLLANKIREILDPDRQGEQRNDPPRGE